MVEKRVIQTTLQNGLTLLVCPKKDAEKVSIQLWYNVGSKHEKSGEKGIAHFIEHMIFKGTSQLTESDINLVTSKLSGVCNAFTSYDYTGYLFDIPVANWDKVLPIMADCMQNCTFKQEHLNSELKAVIQELKMYKDNYGRTLAEIMVTNLFEAHPYHYPIIGYKQDLWSVTRETLIAFYKKYYTPDNAVMIIVGDVNPAQVHEKIEQEFGTIPRGTGWNKEEFYHNEEVQRKSVQLFRDIKQPICTLAFLVPGIVTKNEFTLESLAYVLANGRGSRLYKLLVDQLQLVVSVQAYTYDLFDKGVFFIEFHPHHQNDIAQIVEKIHAELDRIAQGDVTLAEVLRAQRFAQIDYQEMLEDTERQAYAIGKSFLAFNDPLYPFDYGNVATEQLQSDIQKIVQENFSALLCHQGQVLPIPEKEIALLNQLQVISDKEDARILDGKQREELVEEGDYVHSIILNPKKNTSYPKPQVIQLANGMDVLISANDSVDIVEIQLDLKASHYYDPVGQEGVAYIVSKLMLEGTKNYPGLLFAQTIESFGMSFSVSPGSITTTVLKDDLQKGLEFLVELLTNAQFTQEALDKVKAQAGVQLHKFWDTPNSFSVQLARNAVYKDHPYHKMILGSLESLERLTLQDCQNYYQKMISPYQARLAIVGNIHGNIMPKVEELFVGWKESIIEELVYPVVTAPVQKEIVHVKNRDQIVLVFAGASLDRNHEDYDKVLLFNQIFTGGTLGSMSSRLFQLREQSGLFYTIGGSLLYGATKEPGMIMIKTIVSADRMNEALQAILHEVDYAIDVLPEEELQEAKNAVINSFDGLYETNEQKASTFLFLQKYNLPFDYFEKRIETLQKINVEQVQQAVKKFVHSSRMVVVKVGRL
jgi:zinc protease